MSTQKSKQKLSDRYSSTDKRVNNRELVGYSRGKSTSLMLKILVGVSILIVVALVVVVFLGTSNSKNDIDTKAYNLVVTPDDIDEVLDKENKVQQGAYDVTMNNTWRFENARMASSDAYVQNTPTNRNVVNFIVTRSDNNEKIYESPYIPVGSHIQNIKLDDGTLSAGTYPCVLTYQLVNDEYKVMSTVSINITIVIEND